jgi:hypothetical protein
MSSAVETFQMLDPRLSVSDNVRYAVEVGAQSQNQQVFVSQTASPSQVTANCLIPSLQTIIDRNVRIRTTFTIQVTGNVAGANPFLVGYPDNLVFSPFPFSQMVQTLTCQINNTSVNSNYESNLALMLRQMDQSDLAKYSDFAPCSLDYYQQPDAVGAHGTLSAFNNADQTALGYDVKSRGTFLIDSITGDGAGGGGGTVQTATITITTTEPLFISPFLFGDGLCDEASGLSGVSSINLNFNIGPTLVGRAFTIVPAAGGNTITSCILSGIPKFEVLMTFLSPKPSQLIPLTNCLPYYEMPSYKTVQTLATAAGATFDLTSSIVSPNSIPDSVYMFVRDSAQSAIVRAQLNEFYYPIQKVAITWNTQSGLLASAQQQTLYEMSKRRGLKMDWPQFRGDACGVGALNTVTKVATTGGIICLSFNKDIPIQEQYYSSGSLGLWSYQCQVTCLNNTANALAGAVELVVVFFQSGIFQSTSGSSSQYIGVLSKDEVLRVSQEPYITHNEHRRIVGGDDHFLSSMMKGSEGKMKALVKGALGDALEASGRGMSAGNLDASGKGMSAGRRGPRTY